MCVFVVSFRAHRETGGVLCVCMGVICKITQQDRPLSDPQTPKEAVRGSALRYVSYAASPWLAVVWCTTHTHVTQPPKQAGLSLWLGGSRKMSRRPEVLASGTCTSKEGGHLHSAFFGFVL